MISSFDLVICEYSPIILAITLDRLLCKLLRAPSMLDYICSMEGIEIAIDTVSFLRRFGGAGFLKIEGFKRDVRGHILPRSWKRHGNHLAPKAAEKFLNGIL